MADPVVLQRRQRVLAVVAVLALVAAFVLLLRTASERSEGSVDPKVEDEASPEPASTRSVQGTALPSIVEATSRPFTRTTADAT